MSIYTSAKVLPYVYLCTHKTTGEFYIGYRCANKLPACFDLPKYKTSSKYVKPRFHEFEWFIIAEFFDRYAAYDFEQILIQENWGSKLLLNRSVFSGSSKRFIKTGEPWNKNKPRSEQTKEKIRETKRTNPKPGPWSGKKSPVEGWNRGLKMKKNYTTEDTINNAKCIGFLRPSRPDFLRVLQLSSNIADRNKRTITDELTKEGFYLCICSGKNKNGHKWKKPYLIFNEETFRSNMAENGVTELSISRQG